MCRAYSTSAFGEPTCRGVEEPTCRGVEEPTCRGIEELTYWGYIARTSALESRRVGAIAHRRWRADVSGP